jgi:hypothetical protein
MKPQAGDWVQVRSKPEILRTLDENGRLDGLPFMPQMFRYCGLRLQVNSRAYKTCDTVSGHYRGLQLSDAVHLNVRCDGEAYGGCQANCLLFWKTAWLRPFQDNGNGRWAPDAERSTIQDTTEQCSSAERSVWKATTRVSQDPETQYSCQATELLNYTVPLRWWDARQYVEAYTSGNRSLGQVCVGLFYLFYYYATFGFSDRWGGPSRWLYNKFQAVVKGVPFPRVKGRIPAGRPTPRCDLHLKPGELVRVKSYDEILATLDTRLSNRGLQFDAELVPFCGKVFRVSTCVERFVDEKTGKMRRMKTPAVILEGVTCNARYSGRRLFCPRGINLWWREIWLERVPSPARIEAAVSLETDACTFANKGVLVKG